MYVEHFMESYHFSVHFRTCTVFVGCVCYFAHFFQIWLLTN